MDYSKMSDFEINCAVARAAGLDGMMFFSVDSSFCQGPVWDVPSGITEDGIKISRGNPFTPCNNAADAWPIITENNISIILDNPTMPCATANARDLFDDADPIVSVAYDKPLRAAMIVYLQLQEAK
ncbi:DUF2591 family protein [Pseudescherichia vulneris]|uniref:phage protein NinX family protein n=1 Tax=Pseudescherichia vulneris TaxID=566 RepID=UPI00227C63AC|nr:phage protein NinX family protein [Pseudescherichia vulneris]WAH52563.1 DUF2591 family protein [Pseudescherichia vulneris]